MKRNDNDWKDWKNPDLEPKELHPDEESTYEYPEDISPEDDYMWKRPEKDWQKEADQSRFDDLEDVDATAGRYQASQNANRRSKSSRSSENLYRKANSVKERRYYDEEFVVTKNPEYGKIIIRSLITLVLLGIIALLFFAIRKEIEQRDILLKNKVITSTSDKTELGTNTYQTKNIANNSDTTVGADSSGTTTQATDAEVDTTVTIKIAGNWYERYSEETKKPEETIVTTTVAPTKKAQ